MWRIFKALLFLLLVGAVALVVYAYVGPMFFPADFAAPQSETTKPVILDID